MYAYARSPNHSYIPERAKPKSFFSNYYGNISKEFLQLTIGALLVLVVGFTLYISLNIPSYLFSQAIVLNGILFILVFVLHEYAHKAVARWYGYKATFYLNSALVVLMLITFVLPYLKVAVPGLTKISPETDKQTAGKIYLAGPLFNIGLSVILVIFISFLQVGYELTPSLYLNSVNVAFNLVPLNILDGNMILQWNRIVWGFLFALSVVLVILSVINIGL